MCLTLISRIRKDFQLTSDVEAVFLGHIVATDGGVGDDTLVQSLVVHGGDRVAAIDLVDLRHDVAPVVARLDDRLAARDELAVPVPGNLGRRVGVARLAVELELLPDLTVGEGRPLHPPTSLGQVQPGRQRLEIHREVCLLGDGGEVVPIGGLAAVLHVVLLPGDPQVEPGHGDRGPLLDQGLVLVLDVLALSEPFQCWRRGVGPRPAGQHQVVAFSQRDLRQSRYARSFWRSCSRGQVRIIALRPLLVLQLSIDPENYEPESNVFWVLHYTLCILAKLYTI